MIHLIQCLCPKRHAIFGLAYNPENMKPEDAMSGLRDLLQIAIEKGIINPWCGLCRSREWKYEDAETPYRTMEEAAPHLHDAEQKQRAARLFMDQHRN
jgi:hypothetical protein